MNEHPSRRCARLIYLLAAWSGLIASVTHAAEGMWLFNAPPLERVERECGVRLSPLWLAHLQRAAVRFNSGGSGSFVSPDGLVLTNHHVAADALQKLGDATRDLYRDGFQAATRDDEPRCPDLELNVLESIEDVTARVEAAVPRTLPAAEAFAARRRVMAEIEKESLAATGLRSDVVTLHQGGLYHLYRFKKYTDVRLVFAPERQIAFFGGDADNFEFPRYDLDVCFFRAYEDGRPARVSHHLSWARRSIAENEPVFVAGHPGHTDRQATVRELEAKRDWQIPFTLSMLNRLESLYAAYAEEGPEERRQAAKPLFGVQNARKNRTGLLAALLDPAVMARKRAAEAAIRELVARRRATAGSAAEPGPFERIEEAEASLGRVAVRHAMLEGAAGFNSQFFTHARTLLRAAEEAGKPSGERLREYRDSARASLEQQLFSPEPLHDSFETVKLADSLTALATTLGPEDELVVKVLDGRSPRERAAMLVAGTRLGARAASAAGAALPDRRRELYDGGAAAVAASDDPMLALARLVDAESRRLRGVVETAGEVKRQAHAEIARAVFDRDGAAVYPDATFTLRLAYGTVKAYEEGGHRVAPVTDFAGLLRRASEKREQPPFDLPQRWRERRSELERDATFLATPFNFASTADIVGGNSGSPVVNAAGELVGVIFDGNIQSLLLGLAYDDAQARAVSVDAGGVVAALARVYGARQLVAEIEAARQGPAADAAPAAAVAWRPLFDGRDLGRWKSTEFGGEGKVTVADGVIRIAMGVDLSGITWSGEFPRDSYEISLEARRVEGSDFFCGLTFPVGKDFCSLILGGWGGSVTGLSSLDGQDASENATTQLREYEQNRWYAVTVRVTPERIECFLDGEQIIDERREGRLISVRGEVVASQPLGVATYATTAELRDIRWRPIEAGR